MRNYEDRVGCRLGQDVEVLAEAVRPAPALAPQVSIRADQRRLQVVDEIEECADVLEISIAERMPFGTFGQWAQEGPKLLLEGCGAFSVKIRDYEDTLNL